MKNYSFTKQERLKRKKWIQALFAQGKKLKLPSICLYYLPYQPKTKSTHQVVFCVPKKHIKKAVDRNTIKRRLREAYRLSKHQLRNTSAIQVQFLIGYVYTGKTLKKAAYKTLFKDVQRTLAYLQQWHSKHKREKIITLA